MAPISRRQFILGTTLAGVNLLPKGQLIPKAIGTELVRPDYMIRASTNENPWGPSRVALQAILDSVKKSNLYSGDRRKLGELLAEINNIPQDHVTVGTGSGEILRTAALLANMEDGSIVAPDPTYHDLIRYAERAGSTIIRVPVNHETKEIDLNALYKAIRHDTRCVYLANPNNPIPSIIEKSSLKDFVTEVSKKCMVFVDEAYFEFVEDPVYESMMGLVRNEHQNIIVARTASKIHGLAGLRVGFGFAHPDIIKRINSAKTGALNVLGINAAIASYHDKEFQNFTIRKNKESLRIVEDLFDSLNVRYIKSHANFTFLHTGRDIQEVRREFYDEGIMVGRPFPPMTDWLRVSMGKPHEMEYFVQTYQKLMG